MKRIYFALIFITVIVNMYLIFLWKPNLSAEDIPVTSYGSNNSSYSSTYDIVESSPDYKDYESNEVSFYFNEDEKIENLSEDDMNALNNILSKLSTSDLAKWIDLKNDENNDTLIEFFRIVQRRMSNDDYGKVKGILGKIIDIDKFSYIYYFFI